MATHPHGGSISVKLERLLAEYDSKAAAIRTTLSLLNGEAKATKTNGHSTVLAQAIALDAARSNGHGAAPKKRKKGKNTNAAKHERGQRTARILAAFDTNKPTPLADAKATAGVDRIAIGPLIHTGYLRKKGNGYLRTAKAFGSASQ